MGSLVSSPKPSGQKIVYLPAAPVSVQPSVSEEAISEEKDPTTAESVAEARRKNLLSRNRGRFGTIRTGFTGILTKTSQDTERKRLLGD